MKFGLWSRLVIRWWCRLPAVLLGYYQAILALLAVPPPEEGEWKRRITFTERNIVLPIKVAALAMFVYSFTFSPWIRKVSSALDMEVEATQYFFWVYVLANFGSALVLFNMGRLSFGLVQWVVFATCLMDGVFISTLTLVTGGYNSILYWLFLALIARSAIVVPRATSQLMLNVTLSCCYILAGYVDVLVARNLTVAQSLGEVGEGGLAVLRLQQEYPPEPVLLRVVLLGLMTVCCYGVQILVSRQRQALEEAREFALREGQLQSAGRLAAEFAHQIKNPLAIINTAAFSLRRVLKERREDPPEQIRIIEEEVERSDRIITEVMGYAQLSEGRVEKLNVIEELDHAIERVFPPAAGYPVRVHREYDSVFPPLLMQRGHVSGTFLNLLQNAREAFNGAEGNVYVTARCLRDHSIEVTIRDDGPGIPADKHEKVFEAYYTTKEKGTGLGLATVKHNLELYGGTVRVESELGKGALFTVTLPAKSMVRLASKPRP